MANEISFTRFAHPDTNIISIVCRDLGLWRPLDDFLRANDLCLGISGAQVAELSDAKHLHESLKEGLPANCSPQRHREHRGCTEKNYCEVTRRQLPSIS